MAAIFCVGQKNMSNIKKMAIEHRVVLDTRTKRPEDLLRNMAIWSHLIDLNHIMDERDWILNQANPHFIPELKKRWRIFFERDHFCGVLQ
ncbi:hypothetical protein OJAV_G00237200 [Oryzias javanicus]|uniref:Uncharacterized protein n=1 Tax=Oryzias javanicus TaxID=123683 RepID=A0A437BY71_ORYJA|nr:hypothetical protein OJAV_G00237200 [Oryzias javanicus]